MILYPAMDILDGECVRLTMGDYKQKTVYSSDPIAMIKSIEAKGASCLHLVDLSGARDPLDRQTDLICKIISSTQLKVQYGGGLRTRNDIKQILDLGVDRLVLGSLTVSSPVFTKECLDEFGADRFTMAMDIKKNDQGQYGLATHGWSQVGAAPLAEWVNYYLTAGVRTFLCTDISKDGKLQGPNVDLYKDLLRTYPDMHLIASGGVSSIGDLKSLQDAGLHAAVVGKALYENKIDLIEAIQLCSPKE